jgi:hypothetical protein
MTILYMLQLYYHEHVNTEKIVEQLPKQPLESHLEGKKHILKKQNPNFVFGKKKKAWFVKFLILKNHFLEMKFKASFSKCAFNQKHS